MFGIVAIANLLDSAMIGEPVLRMVACWWYIGNEGLSILENCGEIGVPIPQEVEICVS